MHIERLCYKGPNDEEIGPICFNETTNVIFGKNGAGKTRTLNVLKSISAMHTIVKVRHLGDFEIVLRDGDIRYEYRYKTKENPDNKMTAIVDTEYLCMNDQKGSRTLFDRQKKEIWNEETEKTETYNPIDNELSLHYVKDTKKHKTALFIKEHLMHFELFNQSLPNLLQIDPNTFIDSISSAVSPDEIFSKVKNFMQQIFPQIADISRDMGTIVFPSGVTKSLKTIFLHEAGINNNKPYFFLTGSSGIAKVLAIVTLLFSKDTKSLILIDELENGLDYESIVKLKDIIDEAGFEQQIIITTHSPLLANCFDFEHWIIAQREGMKTKFFRIKEDDDLKRLLMSNLENYSLYTQNLLNLEEHHV